MRNNLCNPTILQHHFFSLFFPHFRNYFALNFDFLFSNLFSLLILVQDLNTYLKFLITKLANYFLTALHKLTLNAIFLHQLQNCLDIKILTFGPELFCWI